MGKKSRIAAAAKAKAKASASTSTNKSKNNPLLIQNLETVNRDLLKEAIECRKQMKHLASMAAERDLLYAMERDNFRLVLTSTFREAAAHKTAELMNNNEESHLNAAQMRLLSVVREMDEKKKELACLKESLLLRSLEKETVRHKSNKTWNNWLFYTAAAATATFLAVTAVTLCCKSSGFRNYF